MNFLEELPLWLTFISIIGLRIIDVSVGTVRTISVVQGRVKLSLLLGFCEVLVWIFAASQVLTIAQKKPILMIAYAMGFACGNAIGILLEKKLALGMVVIRMISCGKGEEIADLIRDTGQLVTVFQGSGRYGPRQMLYIVCRRRDEHRYIELARSVEPEIMHAIETITEAHLSQPLPHATGWRALLKGK